MVCPQPVGPPPGYHSKKVNTDDMTLIGSLGLDRTDEQRNIYIANIPHYDIHVLEQPYPPANCWASESIKATQDWFKTWYPNGVTGVPAKLADSRKPRTLRERAATIQINQTLLRNVVANESVIFEDPSLPLERRVVLIIIRDFVPDKRVVNYIGGHSLDAVTDRINSRRDDPGSIVQSGYAGGSVNNRRLDFARNLHTKFKYNEEQIQEKNATLTGVTALLWNMCRKSLPPSIIAEYNEVIEKKGLPRFDINQKGKPSSQTYRIKVDGTTHEITGGQLAPPSAAAALNYARATHSDINENDYMIAYTAECTAPPASGGNFYNSTYGIKVDAAANTLVVWNVNDLHGTTMYEMLEGRMNYGIGLMIPRSLDAAMRRQKAAEEAGNELGGWTDNAIVLDHSNSSDEEALSREGSHRYYMDAEDTEMVENAGLERADETLCHDDCASSDGEAVDYELLDNEYMDLKDMGDGTLRCPFVID